jgi:hypothetical protein
MICFDAVNFREKKTWDFKFSKSSFEFLRIHIWLTPLLEYAVEQYLRSDSLIAVSSLVSNKDSGLVEHLLEHFIPWVEASAGICKSPRVSKGQ